jgi:hypothetical protein
MFVEGVCPRLPDTRASTVNIQRALKAAKAIVQGVFRELTFRDQAVAERWVVELERIISG